MDRGSDGDVGRPAGNGERPAEAGRYEYFCDAFIGDE
jgi:hypothetical protein